MGSSFSEEHTPYFFSQRRDRRFQRRFRKTLDDVSVFGEKRDPLQAPRADGESAGELSRVAELTRARRQSSVAGKLVDLSGKVVLPPVDKDGPWLVVSGDPTDAVETKSTASEGKQKVPDSVTEEAEARSGWTKVKGVYKFNELKFGSTSILLNLAKLFGSAPFTIFDNTKLDPELVQRFLHSHQSLTSDIVVEKREWQTDCYLDLSLRNKQSFLTAPPEEDNEKQQSKAVIPSIAEQHGKKKNKQSPKRVTMSKEVVTKWKSVKRPPTAHSTLSNLSFRSDYSRASSDDDQESRINDSHYDVLPAELRPSIMLYKRESLAPRIKVKGPRTRLEKFRAQASGDRQTTRRKQKRLLSVQMEKSEQDKTDRDKAQQMRPKTAGQRKLSIGGGMQPPTAIAGINFSLGDSESADKGWLVHPATSKDPEMATLFIWDRKAEERLRKREEEKLIARQQSADGPIVVKFYSDPQTRSLRSKHQRSATFPLPTVLSRLPPSVANFTTPGVASGDVMMIGEGPQLAVLIHPDGSGHANYYNKYGQRQAVSQSRMDRYSKSLYTVAYDDTEAHPVLACFSPFGKGWCYYPGSGALQMFYDSTELRMYSEDGHVIRRYLWISDKVSVSIQLNPFLSFRCTSQISMILRFSCRGQQYKFDISPSTSTVEYKPSGLDAEDSSVVLKSGLEFMSDAAHARMRTVTPPPPPPPEPKHTPKHKTKRNRTQSEKSDQVRKSVSHVWEEEEEARAKQSAADLDQNLAEYRERIKNTVNEWMSHYRQAIGISLPSHLRTALSGQSLSSSPLHSRSGSTRQLHSSMSYGGEVIHSRPVSQAQFYTHPLPSRVTSPFRGQSRSKSPHTDEEEDAMRTHFLMTPPPPSPLPLTPIPAVTIEHIAQPSSDGRSRLHKSDGGKVHKRSSTHNKRYGCPVALHNLLLNDLDNMPPCKCDKRHPPYICDLEYDVFLRSHVPISQVVVVCVLSSINEQPCSCQPMLDALHFDLARRRFSPCTECAGDAFRLVKYDLSHCQTGTKRTTPLLVERHAAGPGMFLMYVGGHLVHADYVFNGYGTTKRDFMKQVQRCSEEASKGHHLPTDYQLTALTGGKQPAATFWAYPLSGVLEFLIPYSPSVQSSASVSEPSETPSEHDGDVFKHYIGCSVGSHSSGGGLQLSALELGALSQLNRKSSRFSDSIREED